jgi:hypothetical protein
MGKMNEIEWKNNARRKNPGISKSELNARYVQHLAGKRGADIPTGNRSAPKRSMVTYQSPPNRKKKNQNRPARTYNALIKNALADIYCRNGSFRVRNLGFTPPTITYGAIADVSLAGPTALTDAWWICGNPGLLGIGGAYYGSAVSSATNFTPSGGTAVSWGAVNPSSGNQVTNRPNAAVMEVYLPLSPAEASGSIWYGHIAVENIGTGVTLNELKLLKTIKKISCLDLIMKKVVIPMLKYSEESNEFTPVASRTEAVMIPILVTQGIPINKEIEIKLIEYGEAIVDDTDPYFNQMAPCIGGNTEKEAKVYKEVMQSTGQNSAGLVVPSASSNNNYFEALSSVYNKVVSTYNDPNVQSAVKYGTNLLLAL